MSLINTCIKPFKNIAYKNGQFITITEKDIKGKWSIFFFYPANFTFVCPTELDDLSDHYTEFQTLSTEIYSISTDTQFSHVAWCNTSNIINKIQFTMISDSHWTLTRNFNVMRKYIENNEEKELGLAERATFIIDPNGIIQVIEITSEGIGRNAIELLRKLRAAQHVAKYPNEVCPAKWIPGKDILKPSIDLIGKI
uniref:Alkyl hydroperoxide reductase C n=1 Tax=Candidatus Aschnera chinzeii TaxID=1485666 RepID=A0AAT9G517_9ENTR|nr:MAG: alkyl hydroperoxide reductase subunit C [Candidatus Aschnera chinzeii]